MEIIDEFKCGAAEEMNFTYCGKEVAQDGDYNIKVTCASTTKKLEPIRVKPGRKNSDLLDTDEVS